MDTIYTLHHFACSGGTIISRMIGGLDRAVVLSEIHVDRNLPQRWNPLWQFKASYGLIKPEDQDDLDRVFLEEIKAIQKICKRENRVLFIRDHFHHDTIDKRQMRSRTSEVLSQAFNVKRIYTYRDPMEIWSSMRLHNWQRNVTLEQFLQIFLDAFDYFSDALQLSYHDACTDPKGFTRAVFDYAGMSGMDGDLIGKPDEREHYTGGSGRQSEKLSARPTRWGILSDAEIEFLSGSALYQACCERAGLPALKDRDLPDRVADLVRAGD